MRAMTYVNTATVLMNDVEQGVQVDHLVLDQRRGEIWRLEHLSEVRHELVLRDWECVVAEILAGPRFRSVGGRGDLKLSRRLRLLLLPLLLRIRLTRSRSGRTRLTLRRRRWSDVAAVLSHASTRVLLGEMGDVVVHHGQ